MKSFDYILFLAVLALTVFGQIAQAHATGTPPSFAPLALGVVTYVVAAFVAGGGRAGRLLRGRGAWIVWATAAALMLALLVFGRRYRGGLYLPGRLNPSELVKFCLVAFAASRLSAGGRDGAHLFETPRDLGIFVLAFGALVGTVALAGDFGMLAQLALTLAAMLFAASWFWGVAAFLSVAGGLALVACTPICQMGHFATRFAVWRDPLSDAMGAGWQTLHGLAAVVNGGVFGLGRDLAEVSKVPIVASDFIYAAVAEVWGLVGCLLVLGLWCAVLVRGLVAAYRRESAGDRCGALLAAGLTASLGVQALLNVAGVLNALPMTGITLPLVSHGGSSLVVTQLMCGVLLALASGAREEPSRRVRAPRRRKAVRSRA